MVIVQCVENGFALAPDPHELGILQHPQLVAHGRLAQLHGAGNVAMSFSDVAVLLTLIGGTIFVTFQITWKIATSDKKRKKK